jgi:hypothetical protein
VLSPPELIERLQRTVAEMGKRYGAGKSKRKGGS